MTSQPDLAVAIHDRGYVHAPPRDVFEVVARLSEYPGWWARVTVRPASAETAQIILAGLGKVDVSIRIERPPESLILDVRSARVAGTFEWFLQPHGEAGTIANVLLGLSFAPGWGRRRELAYRTAVRRGLVGLKDLLEARPTG